MVKPWSISTTVRSPDRLKGFLSVLAQIEGARWDGGVQMDFQARLIQARLFGAFNNQFYSDLPQKWVDLLESQRAITPKQAAEIFAAKKYTDPAMRGRTSFKPLQKFGFAALGENKEITITETGRVLLAENDDYGEIFLRCFLKWQLPNPIDGEFPARHGYNIKPFVGVLRLIDCVNRLCRKNKMPEKGLSSDEFKFFALTLIDWRDIEKTADKIIALRRRLKTIPAGERDSFIEKEARRFRPNFEFRHLRDYADNAIRYFRMTKYIRLRGWGDHIDLEESRGKEINALFGKDTAKPDHEQNYADYLASATMPDLPGETQKELAGIIEFLSADINRIGGKADKIIAEKLPLQELKTLRDDLRARRQTLVRMNEKQRLGAPDEAEKCLLELRQLTNRKRGDVKPSVMLEFLVAQGLDILNDAEKIQPNFPIGDDGEPSSTAPGGKADIECYYGNFAAICEVTMLSNGKQWIHEAQPVMRHLRDFRIANDGKEVFCLFIAPGLHADSLNTFGYAANAGYEGDKQRIAPLTISQFCDILDFCIRRMRQNKRIARKDIRALLESLADSIRAMQKTDEWRKESPRMIEKWKQSA